MLTLKNLYETDYALWLEETAKHLRHGNLVSLDIENLLEEIENLLEEIEAMGRSERRAIRHFPKILPKCYQNARNMASDQTGLNLSICPQNCPFTST